MGINSVIADNSGLPLNVIFSSINGSTFELFNTNSYTGTTYVNSSILNLRNPNDAAIPGNLVITGGANSGNDNLQYTQAVARLQYNQQVGSLLAPVDVTVRGTAFFDLNGYTQTVNNLILQQPGGSYGNIGAQVGTGVGALTILGQISSNNILAIAGVPTINGFINQKGNGLAVNVAAPESMPLQIALALNTTLQNTTSLTKTGSGVLGVGGRSLTFTGPIDVNEGTLAISASGAFLGEGSAVVLNESLVKTALDLRGIGSVTVGSGQGSAFIGSLAGTGTLTNFNPTAGATLATGLDNTSTTFTGTITNPFVGGLLSLNKVGTGTFTLGGDSIAAGGNSPNLGTLNVQVGGVTLGGYARASFSTTNVLAGASLVLDSSLVARNNRLGGTFLLGSAAVAAPVSLAGNTYSNATLNVADSTGLFAGMTVTGPGIATGTTIATILGTTLTLSANAATSVAGGTFNFGTARTLNLAGGTVSIVGNTSTAVIESTGTLGLTAAGSTLTLAATGTAGIGIQAVALSGQNGYSTALIRGDLLGSAVGTADAASVSVTNALTYASIGGQANGALGLTSLSIRSDIIADTSSTGLGSGFLTQDLATGLLRPLNQTTELLSSTAGLTLATKAQNVGLSSASARQSIGGSVQLNSLTLLTGGNLTGVAGTPSTAVVTVNSSGILALASSAISVPQSQSQGRTMDIHVVGAGTALTLHGSISNTTQGLVKAGDGSLVFAAPQYFTGATGINGLVINGGTVQLAGGRNTVLAYTSGTGAVLQTLIANAGTLDLNGNSQAFERLQSANILPGGGGIITNTAGTVATLTLASTVSTTFGGAINGNLNLLRIGTGTQTFSNALGFTGVANIGGAVTLTDQATLSAASAINLNGSAGTLILDNRGMFGNAARIGTVPVTLNGGKLSFQSTIVQNDAQSVGAVTVGAGAGTLDVTLYNTTASAGSATLTVASLAQNTGGTLNFSSSGAGALGSPLSSESSTGYVQGGFVASPTSAPRIVFTAAPTLTNGIIGGWATVGTDWAT